ncbi:PREDICTED: P-selectin [Myotis davidii]|uniref:P-selectin n=1 Tax=Myotis davidii TaxID=225400 RepID=UPI000766EC1C|nr:PREDICTED: P-selectin [Myotis davidii]
MARCLSATWNWRSRGVVFIAAQLLRLGALLSEIMNQTEVAAWTYHISTKAYSWNASRGFCQKYYTDLVAIQNKDEIAYLNEVIPYYSHYYWIGIRKINNKWTWVGTNKTLTEEAENWADHEPNNKKNNQDCVEIYIKSPSAPGRWNDEPCWRRKRPLCYTGVETIGNYTCSCHPGFYGPECEYVRECGGLELPPHVLMDCSHPLGSFSFNSRCGFHCAEGYTLDGPRKLECLASGTWTNKPPQCVAILCPPLRPPERGRMSCLHGAEGPSHQASCSFTCEEGSVLVGPELVRCTASGAWTGSAPVCEAIACEPPERPAHGSVDCSPSSRAWPYNATCRFRCAEGFKLHGADTVRCADAGQWTAPAPLCQALQCQDLPAPNHARVKCVHPFGASRYQSACSFACAEGFLLVGARELRCLATGTWSAAPPECQAITCTPLRSPQNGTVACAGPLGDSSASLFPSCPGSHHLHTSAKPAERNGGLRRPPGRLQLSVHMPVHLQRGVFFIWTRKAGLHSIWALDGFPTNLWRRKARGEALDHTCGQKTVGAWGALGTLEAKVYREEDETLPSGVGLLHSCDCCPPGGDSPSAMLSKCTHVLPGAAPAPTAEVRCPALVAPGQGVMSCQHPLATFGLNSTCHFGCKAGFQLRGEAAVRCGRSGRWTAATPACRAVQCSELHTEEPVLMNCSSPWGHFSYGATCTFHCPEGQSLNGSAAAACGPDGQWSAATPTCQAGPLTVQEALTYVGGAVASTTGLVMGGTLLALLRRRCRQKDDGKDPLNPHSHLGTYGVFTNAAFDPSP